ncbi:DUF6090 family protein [Gaetbulibacter aestuarii]|uniref:DUF6090 family protein n=1 Tax=Gaetbulibacter aestuarii TaxID=1502358 RepID=A0ABW7MV83_9FLAO
MIKIFRSIRQKLLREGKVSSYLKYAIGEIVLVVIGILIALSINNWNENRKEHKVERNMLLSIKEELKYSLNELKNDLETTEICEQATRNVYSYIQTNPKLVDSMYDDFYNLIAFDYSFPKTSAYQSLKSGNIEIIKSDTLRDLITYIYESGYKRLQLKIETRRNAARLLFPYYQKHFVSKIITDSITHRKNIIGIPNNYEDLMHDPEFETLIVEAINGRANFRIGYERTIEVIETCIKQIDTYLKL